jgi:hypothetical protein
MEDMKEYAYVIGKRNLVTAAEEIRKRDEY